MGYALLADAIAFVHALFVLFVIFGSVLVLRWPRAVWLHLPALAWGVIVELSGAMCPLTPLEFRFRVLAGQSGYSEDFLSRWLLTVLYPDQLTREVQIVLGASLLALNLALYLWIWRTRRR
ncbi:MAG TPA: DUF2784 domain-containing protein [Nitrospira sp.]|nr:DUF2784 domain-containing protein [Nitrospira sp.]